MRKNRVCTSERVRPLVQILQGGHPGGARLHQTVQTDLLLFDTVYGTGVDAQIGVAALVDAVADGGA
jgi:hypothetical protein